MAGQILGVFSSQDSTEGANPCGCGRRGDSILSTRHNWYTAGAAPHPGLDGSIRQLIRSDLVATALRAIGCMLEALYPFVTCGRRSMMSPQGVMAVPDGIELMDMVSPSRHHTVNPFA